MHHCTCMISIKTLNDKINHCKVTEKKFKTFSLMEKENFVCMKAFLASYSN